MTIIHSPSKLRKLNDNITDPKYDGVKTSRQFRTSHDENENESEEDEDDSESGSYSKVRTPSMHGDSLSSASEDEETHSPMPDGVTVNKHEEASTRHKDQGPKLISRQDEALASTLQRTRVADKLKGKAVSRQMVCL